MNRKEEFLNASIVLDTETTNKDKDLAEIIELGFIKRQNGTIESFDALYKPEVNYGIVKPEISAVTHITTKMVKDKPHFKDCYVTDLKPTIERLLLDGGALIAHNAIYDHTVLNNYECVDLTGVPTICTMRLAKHLFMEDDTVEFYNLGYLRYRFELDVPDNIELHRASTDAFITMKLLEFLIGHMEEKQMLDQTLPYVAQLVDLCEKPMFLPKMMFGKHNGKSWDDIPIDYVIWMLNNWGSLDDTDPLFDMDLSYTLETILDVYIEEDML